MKLEGVHHVTAITADAPRNVDFYAGTLGLRLVKKTVNQDDPTVYHLFYADETGDPGSDITFFEYPGAQRGQAGTGMVHRIVWRVGSPDTIEFWEERLSQEGVKVERAGDALLFDDPEGLGHEAVRARRLAAQRGRGGLHADAGDRPLLLPLDLRRRAERRAVRAGHDGPRLRHRRVARDARRAPGPAAQLRGAARPGRAE